MEANTEQPINDHITLLIQGELAGYTELLSILERERHLLVSRQFDILSDLLTNKHQIITQLEEINNARIQLLNQSNLPVSSDGMKILISEQSRQKEQTLDDWDKVFQLIEQSSKLNEINAKITHRAQATTGHILSILRGQSNTPNLYSRKGTARASSSTQPYTKA